MMKATAKGQRQQHWTNGNTRERERVIERGHEREREHRKVMPVLNLNLQEAAPPAATT